jgi:hypothetical protein
VSQPLALDAMRSGIDLIDELPGAGAPIVRHRVYRIRLRLWLNKGEPVRWRAPWGFVDRAALADNGETLITDVRLDRSQLVNGLFYGVEGMRIGGTRRLKISPHLAYGERGVPGVIPANAALVAEITFVEESDLGFPAPRAVR